jgi:hypothetical protein
MKSMHPAALLLAAASLAGAGCGADQSRKASQSSPPPPAVYVCQHTSKPVQLDGKLDDAAWNDAKWTADFIDVRGKNRPKPRLRTRCKLLWDDQNLYIAAEMEDPNVWGTMTKQGSHLYEENNFEAFIDWQNSGRNYWELEMNPLNTTWDMQLDHSIIDGGKPIPGHNLKGLRTAVDVQGTLNDPSDRDKGWTAEISIPFAALAADGHVPTDGEHWRLLLCRIEWKLSSENGKSAKIPGTDAYWSWVPTGAIAYHMPWKYGELRFAK